MAKRVIMSDKSQAIAAFILAQAIHEMNPIDPLVSEISDLRHALGGPTKSIIIVPPTQLCPRRI